MAEDAFLTRRQVASWLSERGDTHSIATLETYATRGGGPVYYKRGRRVVYRVSDVRAWLDARTTGPFSNTSKRDC